MKIKFKNGSYIKTIESNESQRVSNAIKDSAKDFDALSSFLAMAEDDRTIYFIEHYMGVKLLPFQKMLIRITNKVNRRRNDMEIEKYITETEQINDGSEVFTANLDCKMDLSEFYEKRDDAMFSFLDLLVK